MGAFSNTFTNPINSAFGLNSSSSMNPLSAFSFGADILQGIFGAWQNDKNLKAQAEENQKNRDFAEKMYYHQRADNISQWQMQNAYNAPDAQVERFKMAGLNPDLLYSGGFNDSAPLQAASPNGASGSVSPQPYSPIELTEKALSIERQKAEIKNIDADTENKESNTRKTSAEASIFESDAKFRDAVNQGQIDASNVQVRLGEKNIELTDAQIADFRKKWESIDQQIAESKARIDQIVIQNHLTSQQAIGQYIDNQFKTEHWKAQINLLKAQTGLAYQQAYDLMATLASRLLLAQAQANNYISGTELNYANSDKINYEIQGISTQNDILKIDLKELTGTYALRTASTNVSSLLNVVTCGMSGTLGGFIGKFVK